MEIIIGVGHYGCNFSLSRQNETSLSGDIGWNRWFLPLLFLKLWNLSMRNGWKPAWLSLLAEKSYICLNSYLCLHLTYGKISLLYYHSFLRFCWNFFFFHHCSQCWSQTALLSVPPTACYSNLMIFPSSFTAHLLSKSLLFSCISLVC